MMVYRIRTALCRGRDWLGRVFGKGQAPRPDVASVAATPPRRKLRIATASLAMLLLACAMPGRAWAACPTGLSFSKVGDVQAGVALDMTCDLSGNGLGASMGENLNPAIGSQFTVGTSKGNQYQFTLTGFSDPEGDPIYRITLVGGQPSVEGIQLFVDQNNDLRTDAPVVIGVTTPAPTISGISPASGPIAGGSKITITGISLASTESVQIGGVLSTFTIDSPTQIQVTTPAMAVGVVPVTVTNAFSSATTSYTYVNPPVIASVSPTAGPTAGGTTVIINGTGFLNATAVTFGATSATGYTVNNDTQITATNPAHGAGTLDITVTTSGGTSTTSASDQFTYVAAPTVVSISPTSGAPAGGTPVTITGTNFSGATAVTFGGVAATGITVVSATSITATSPAGSGTVDVRVTTTGGTSATSAADQFTYIPAPTVTGIGPTAGPTAGGTSVTITGTNFSGVTDVTFGGTSATSFTTLSATSITATSPAGTGTVDVRVTTPSGTSAANASDHFTFVSAPTITGMSPTSGPVFGGTRVTITGTGFSGVTSLTFGGAAASSYSVDSDTQISAMTPANAAGATNVKVTTAGGTNGNGGSNVFTYSSAPTVTGISPAAGPAAGGTQVTITGTNLGNVTAVKFGTVAATNVTAGSSTSVTAFAPAGTLGSTVDITVSGSDGTSLPGNVQFSYLQIPGSPVVGSVTAGDKNAIVYFTPPVSDGGSTITGYEVTANGGITGSGASSPITVTGLTNGTAYTFTVKAINAIGASAPSGASPAVTPKGPQSITFANPGPQNFGATVTLSATADSGDPVLFTSATPNICKLTSGNSLLLTAPGSCTINADQSGNTAFLPAPTVSQTFSVVVPGGAVSFVTTSLPSGRIPGTYNQTIVAANGAPPYDFTVSGTLPNGITLSPSGMLSGTPTQAGTFPITVKVMDQAGQTASWNVSLVIDPPTIDLSASTLSNGQVGEAFSGQMSASGGVGSYTYAVTSGALPAGVTLSTAGVVSGTPTAAGTFNFTVTATDSLNFKGSLPFSVGINQPRPVVVDDTATTPANNVVMISVTNNDTGPLTSIDIGKAPAHGTATVHGLNVEYAPATNFFGTDSFTYTASGPGGTSNQATVTISVTPLAVPVVQPITVSVLAGKTVTLHAAQGATGGPFTGANVATPPATGVLTITGTDIAYTPAIDASGEVMFDYTLSNPFGTSLPAHATITVNPVPMAPSLNAQVLAGASTQVDLTSTAHGGPFTAANLVSVSPNNAGTATVSGSAGAYKLNFIASSGFSGVAQLSYTLSNAYATSEPGVVSVTVTARVDPSKDAEVLGVLNAQVNSTRRMAQGQITNFQQRLERLHSGADASGFSNGITLSSASRQNRDPMQGLRGTGDDTWSRRYLVDPNEPSGTPVSSATDKGSLPGGITVWTGGALNFGKSQPGTSDNGIDFSTSGLSVGADKRINDQLAVGAGVGYGHDVSDIGKHDSRSTTDSYNLAFYASYRPTANVYVDGLLGYQWLSFDSRRYVTSDGSRATGSRDGKQWFGSIALGYEQRKETWTLSPYARLDMAHAQLDGYTEQASGQNALSIERQSVKTTTGNLGVRAEWTIKSGYGMWLPTLRAEFQHDFQGSGVANMRYADLLSGPLYQASLTGQSSHRTMLGAGIQLQTLKGWLIRFEYQNLIENNSRENQSILLGVEKRFDP